MDSKTRKVRDDFVSARVNLFSLARDVVHPLNRDDKKYLVVFLHSEINNLRTLRELLREELKKEE